MLDRICRSLCFCAFRRHVPAFIFQVFRIHPLLPTSHTLLPPHRTFKILLCYYKLPGQQSLLLSGIWSYFASQRFIPVCSRCAAALLVGTVFHLRCRRHLHRPRQGHAQALSELASPCRVHREYHTQLVQRRREGASSRTRVCPDFREKVCICR